MLEPLPGMLDILLVFTVKADQELKGEREGGLEWTVIGDGGSRNNEEVEEKTRCCETNDNTPNNFVDKEEVVGEGITKKEESCLEHEG